MLEGPLWEGPFDGSGGFQEAPSQFWGIPEGSGRFDGFLKGFGELREVPNPLSGRFGELRKALASPGERSKQSLGSSRKLSISSREFWDARETLDRSRGALGGSGWAMESLRTSRGVSGRFQTESGELREVQDELPGILGASGWGRRGGQERLREVPGRIGWAPEASGSLREVPGRFRIGSGRAGSSGRPLGSDPRERA